MRAGTPNDGGQHTLLEMEFVDVIFFLENIVVAKGEVDAVSCASRSLLSLSVKLPSGFRH